MTRFFKHGQSFRVASEEAVEVYNLLPPGNYTIKETPVTGDLYLERIDSFTLPSKLYGKTPNHADRIINTFKSRSGSTGVLLTGEKGSGKTLLAKTLSVTMAEQGVPTIVVNNDFCGDKFNSLIQTIEQPCIVLFDEFEKVYEREEQEAILTLLDGVFPTKKLFVFTVNDPWRVDKHMHNRPGRIFYLLNYTGLDEDFIKEYCEDNLNAKEHIDRICQLAGMFREFNFDMLKALVEEMNRYNESPSEAIAMLNASPEYDGDTEYKIHLKVGDYVYDPDKENFTEDYQGNPLTDKYGVRVSYYSPPTAVTTSKPKKDYDDIESLFNDDDDDDGREYVRRVFTVNDLVSIKDGKMLFKQDDVEVVLIRQKVQFHFDAF